MGQSTPIMKRSANCNRACPKRPLPFGSTARQNPSSAFTVTELAFVLAGIALLLITALPLLGNSRIRSDRLVCGNNLRRIGVAFLTWSDSHQDKIPWQLPQVPDGGTRGTLMDNAWFNYVPLS